MQWWMRQWFLSAEPTNNGEIFSSFSKYLIWKSLHGNRSILMIVEPSTAVDVSPSKAKFIIFWFAWAQWTCVRHNWKEVGKRKRKRHLVAIQSKNKDVNFCRHRKVADNGEIDWFFVSSFASQFHILFRFRRRRKSYRLLLLSVSIFLILHSKIFSNFVIINFEWVSRSFQILLFNKKLWNFVDQTEKKAEFFLFFLAKVKKQKITSEGWHEKHEQIENYSTE